MTTVSAVRRGRRCLGGSLALGLALTLTLFSGDARAIRLTDGPKPVRLEITETLGWSLHTVLDDAAFPAGAKPEDVFILRNRLNLKVAWDQLTVGVRLDSAWFSWKPAVGTQASQYQDDPLRLEEMFLSYRFKLGDLGSLKLTVLDDYVSIGRGMALSLRKVDELGYDLNLRGLHLRWRHKLFQAAAHAGITNVVNVDSVEQKLVPDPNDVVFAGRVEARPLRWLRLGAHAVDIERRNSSLYQTLSPAIPGNTDDVEPDGNDFYLRSLVFGGTLELLNLARALDFYAEVNALTSTTERQIASGRRETTTDGLAVYGSTTLYLDPVTILLEGKHYDTFELESTPHPDSANQPAITTSFPYIKPPTLERFDQRIQNNTDVTGAHLKVDLAIPNTSSTAFLSGAYFADAPQKDEFTIHAYGGYEHTEKDGSVRALAQAGYRLEEAPDSNITRLRMIHFDLDLYILLGGSHDLQFHWAHEFRSKNPGQAGIEDEYIEGTTYVTWNFSPKLSLTAQFEYLNDTDHESEPFFPGAWIQLKFTGSSFMKLFIGRMKGGLKCAGGICRVFPDFEGARLETTFRF